MTKKKTATSRKAKCLFPFLSFFLFSFNLRIYRPKNNSFSMASTALPDNTKCLQFDQNGIPSKVLFLHSIPLSANRLGPHSVLVRWIASPINPVDLYIIQGDYPLKMPKMPAIGGREGVGVVEEIGAQVDILEVGDRVIRRRIFSGPDAAKGVWTEYGIMEADSLAPVDPDIDLITAATLGINPPTAYAMLREIVPLKKGDCVIQNAANSGVGRAVIQLAKYFGYKTINLVRKRANIEELKAELISLGADWVFTEEQFQKDGLSEHFPTPKLALNCVGGPSAFLISSALGKGGLLVNYGEISNCPADICDGVSSQFFSIGQWVDKEANGAKVRKMFEELQGMALNGQLVPPPHKLVPIERYRSAIENAIGHGVKQILLLAPSEAELDQLGGR